jgi:hypothetical protein
MVLRSNFGENGRVTEQAMMYAGVVLTTDCVRLSARQIEKWIDKWVGNTCRKYY